MNIMDLIMQLSGGADPNKAILASAGGSGGGGPATPAPAPVPADPPPVVTAGDGARTPPPPPPVPAAPEGAKTPVTNPIPATASPKALQSPADLANMYMELMKRNQNAAQLDSGLTTIAAGFSNNPVNRAALIQQAGAKGAGGMTMSAADLLNFQKADVEYRNNLIKKNALPALMKQYGLSQAQIEFLNASGKLDEVLQNFSTRSLAHITDANGQVHLVNDRVDSRDPNRIIATIGSEKPEEGTWQDGPNGKVLVSSRDSRQMGAPLGLPPSELLFKDTPEGGVTAIDKYTGKVVASKIGGGPTPETETFERPDGSKFIRGKRDGKIEEVTPARKIGDAIPPLLDELAGINKDRETRGEKPLTAEELLKLKHPGTSVSVNTADNGAKLPAPEPGHDYIRHNEGPNIGQVKIFPDGKPQQYPIVGSKAADEKAKTDKAVTDADEKAKVKARQTYSSVSSVMAAADDVIKGIKEAKPYAPATGFMSSVPALFGSSAATDVRSKLKTIDANVAFRQLQAMRDASPTGGALGNVSDFENRMLAATIGDTNPYQSDAQLISQMRLTKAAMIVLAENNFEAKGGVAAYKDALDKELKKMEMEEGTASTRKGDVRRIN